MRKRVHARALEKVWCHSLANDGGRGSLRNELSDKSTTLLVVGPTIVGVGLGVSGGEVKKRWRVGVRARKVQKKNLSALAE